MKNSMSAPKILPWIARKAGISDELALKLWRRAVSEAEHLTGHSSGRNTTASPLNASSPLSKTKSAERPNTISARHHAWPGCGITRTGCPCFH